jgi:endonuclease YncB( thermonuclease family)
VDGLPLLGRLSLLATALVIASPCAAQSTVDGDTLKQGAGPYRPWGIDAPGPSRFALMDG